MKPLQQQQNKLSQGIYQQLKNGNKVTYNRNFSIKEMEEVFAELFYGKK